MTTARPTRSRPADSKRVRFNREYFGFIVGFPDGEIVLAGESAATLLHPHATRATLAPHLLTQLDVPPGFHLQAPPLVWLELTRKCDLACPHCYINGGRAREGEMPLARWFELLDEMARMGVWAVALTGGEPTLHPDFAEIVRHARKRDLLVGVATHGLNLTDELLDSLPREGVILSVSIDDLHVDRQNRAVSTEQAKASVMRAQKHGFLTNIMVTTHPGNIDALESMISWAKSRGVSARSVPFSRIGRGALHVELENIGADVGRAAEFWLQECEWEHRYHKLVGLCVGAIFNYGLTLAYMTRRCSSGTYLCYVGADGTVFPCTMCAAEELLSPGSVRTGSFADLWRAHWKIRDIDWDNFSAACAGCAINDPKYYCASKCPAMSYARNGTFNECGASRFEIQSTLYRTRLLETTEMGRTSNLPIAADIRVTGDDKA